ncbi:MAG: ABC transporter ATP-binding protein [Desulfarculaceae bacterium]|nr:ABC transporter ATP-binding protein [Desulfarculaceae bacterium]MCF8071487.1 ABC transporter ATP-binding protein [Desulfarculaceae bacterium]MCF8102302.1 ABC transporter ATP-binding protein [Desulfarculaceae bacterium]MCF8114766.1 ABC transporter ATP-binding protein [Desulfarculaceae bacterium]
MTLEATDLHFGYNGHEVLRGLNLSLLHGETVGILGVNGAGKSTLLKCLDRILRPSRGVVMVEDQNLAKLGGVEIARLIGYVAQSQEREPLSVFDAVLLGRKPHIQWNATAHDLDVVSGVLTQMGLDHLALRQVASLSGGEAQKVIIARALAQEPHLLLLDEPTSNLDLRNQLEVMELLVGAVRRQGLGAAVCLHDVNLALRYLDRLVLMVQGRVHALITPAELTGQHIREVYGVEAVLAEVEGHRVVIPQASVSHNLASPASHRHTQE